MAPKQVPTFCLGALPTFKHPVFSLYFSRSPKIRDDEEGRCIGESPRPGEPHLGVAMGRGSLSAVLAEGKERVQSRGAGTRGRRRRCPLSGIQVGALLEELCVFVFS